MLSRLFDKFRAFPWLLLALLATAVVGHLAPHQLGVLVWSLSKLALGAYLGYWIDRTIFHYARPGDLFHMANRLAAQDLNNGARHMRHQASLAALRRVGVIAAAIIALGLGGLAMNYLAAFFLCVAFTVMTALGGGKEVYWLIVSDVNVAIWLWVAWYLGRRKRP